MTDKNNVNGNHKNGLGPVTREKYEKILRDRITRRINALEMQINANRREALTEYLTKVGMARKLSTCRALFKELNAFFDHESYPRPGWLCQEKELLGVSKVRDAVETILRQRPSLKTVFAEIDRLREFESVVAEKVWLADAPEEIAKLLEEICDPSSTIEKPSA